MYHMLYFITQTGQIDVARGMWHIKEMFITDLR